MNEQPRIGLKRGTFMSQSQETSGMVAVLDFICRLGLLGS